MQTGAGGLWETNLDRGSHGGAAVPVWTVGIGTACTSVHTWSSKVGLSMMRKGGQMCDDSFQQAKTYHRYLLHSPKSHPRKRPQIFKTAGIFSF